MKILFILSAILSIMVLPAAAQEEEGVKLDLLKAPSSPASNLLGMAASDVDKPTDVSAFMLSLQKATGNFTALPSNYAFDIAPYWLCKKRKGDNTIEGMKKSTGGNVVNQTFVLSFAIRNTEDDEKELLPNTVYGGAGFKFSIARGRFDTVASQKLNQIQQWQAVENRIVKKDIDSYRRNPEVIMLRDKRKGLLRQIAQEEDNLAVARDATDSTTINSKLQDLNDDVENIDSTLSNNLLKKLQDTEESELKAKIKEEASSFQVTRVGWTLDLAGGVSAAFLDKRFDNSQVHNAGLWLTGGFTADTNSIGGYWGSMLGLARVLYNPDKIFAKDNAPNEQKDIYTFDAGLRYIYSRPQSKFSASLEAIYRSALTSETIKPSWRLIFNADYALWADQKLSFSFGRNYDGTTTKDGNLIAALSFLTGFGNKR